MLLGVWGPFAIGKTTYINQWMTANAGQLAYRHVIFVMADLSQEYRMDAKGHWNMTTLSGTADHWKGHNETKDAHIHDMIADDRYVWVVESARYFSGTYETLVDAHDNCDGGLRFILPVTDGPTMVKFMKDRCAQRGKVFREDYWEPVRVAYEADARYSNAAAKWFKPRGIPYEVVRIDAKRGEFYRMGAIMYTWINLKPDDWYGISHSMRVFANVPEDLELERAKPKGDYRKGRH